MPALATDLSRNALHVLWLDNRYGEGEVSYARCPVDDATPCAAAERVSDQPFRFTTGDNPLRWHGLRSALALAPDGRLWAAWSDTRTGGPAVYLSVGAAP